MKVIAISGWKRSGKDTAADYLINQHNFRRVGFADPLKMMVAEEYDIPLNYCYDNEFKEAPLLQYPVDPQDAFTEVIAQLLENEFKPGPDGNLYWTPRALCILKGSINRSVDSAFWVKRAVKEVKDELDDPSCNEAGQWHEGVVISDLRYRSEVRQLRDVLGDRLVTIRVNRFDSIDTTDPSERDLDDYEFDFTIENKETLEQFYEKLEGVLQTIGGKK